MLVVRNMKKGISEKNNFGNTGIDILISLVPEAFSTALIKRIFTLKADREIHTILNANAIYIVEIIDSTESRFGFVFLLEDGQGCLFRKNETYQNLESAIVHYEHNNGIVYHAFEMTIDELKKSSITIEKFVIDYMLDIANIHKK